MIPDGRLQLVTAALIVVAVLYADDANSARG